MKFLPSRIIAALGLLLACATLSSAQEPPRRALVAAINLSIMTSRQNIAWLYQREENGAARLTRRLIERSYQRGAILEREDATLENFLNELEGAILDPTIDVVDVVLDLHGHSRETDGEPAICFIHPEHKCTPTRLVRELITSRFTPEQRKKLRAMYSDACWGSQQMEDWVGAGFRVVSGSTRTDQNKSIDIRRWMKKWSRGATFGAAIDHANRQIIADLLDKLGQGQSTKQVLGDPSQTIDSP
jgi:hypothetical protein